MPITQRAIMRHLSVIITSMIKKIKQGAALSTRSLLIAALAMAIGSFALHGLGLRNSPSSNISTEEIILKKTREKLESKKSDSDVKFLQEQKDADLVKILGVITSLQGTLSGKRALNSSFFKALDKSSVDLTEVLKNYNLDDIKEVRLLKNQTDVLMNAALMNQAIIKMSESGNNLMGLSALTPSSNSFTNNNSFLDLERIPKDSILRKMGEAMQGFAKNIDSLQKNMLDTDSLTALSQSLSLGVQQIRVLEEKSSSLNAQAKDTLESLRQTPWPTKGPQLNKDLQSYIEQLSLLRKLLSDSNAWKIASETVDTSSTIKLVSAQVKVDPSKLPDSVKPTEEDSGMDFPKLSALLLQIAIDLNSPKPFSPQYFQSMNKWKSQIDEILDNAPTVPNMEATSQSEVVPLKNQSQLLMVGLKVQESLNTLVSLEKSALSLKAQGSTAAIMTAPNALLDLNKIAVESPLRPLAMSFDEFQKANINWQKNIVDSGLSNSLDQAINKTNEQINGLEATIQNQPPQVVEVLSKIRQIAWQNKAADSKATLKSLSEQFDFLKKQLADQESITRAAKNKSSVQSPFPKLPLGLLQALSLALQFFSILLMVGALFRLKSLTSPSHPAQAPAIDSGDVLEKKTPYLTLPKESKPSQLVPDLHEKISALEQKFIKSYQSSEKIMTYSKELLSKVSQLRTEQLGSMERTPSLQVEVTKPLEEIDSAIISLKQIGIRLFLSILENHSIRQLALETEEMNSLVKKTEEAFADVKALVKEINEKAVPKRHSSDQAGIDLIELDVNQVLKEVKRWQDDLTDLNQSMMSLNELVGQYV